MMWKKTCGSVCICTWTSKSTCSISAWGLKTQTSPWLTYNAFVFFSSRPEEQWRLRAGRWTECCSKLISGRKRERHGKLYQRLCWNTARSCKAAADVGLVSTDMQVVAPVNHLSHPCFVCFCLTKGSIIILFVWLKPKTWKLIRKVQLPHDYP